MRTRLLVLSGVVLVSGLLATPASAQEPATKAAKPAAAAAPAAAARKLPTTQLTWYGHAAFRIQTPTGKTLLIDPWIDNPANKNGKADLARLTAVDLILVTHGHADHIGNAVEIARRTRAKLVATFDLGKAIVSVGYPAAQAGMDSQGNFGGTVELLDGEVTIAFVPAVHSSQVTKDDKSPGIDGGAPGGFLISVKNGPTIYHTGDTDVFGDMALIPEHHAVDVMLACIGGHFTMDPARAARAAKLVKARTVVPMHYGTFPLLKGTPEALGKAMKKQGARGKLRTLVIGEPATL